MAAYGESGALFRNLCKARMMKLTLEELRHPQDALVTYFHTTTVVGIANGTVKQQRLWATEMKYFWVCGQVKQCVAKVEYHPCQECLADYPNKQQDVQHHQQVHPIYHHEDNGPLFLKRTLKPINLRGYVGHIPAGYKQSLLMLMIQQAIHCLTSTHHLPLAYRSLTAQASTWRRKQ